MKFFKSLNFKKVMSTLLIIFNFLYPNISVSALIHTYEVHIPIVGDAGVGKTTIFNNLKKYGEISHETENSYCLKYADEFGRVFNMYFYDINIDLDKDVDKTNFSCQKLNTILPQIPYTSLIVFDYGNESTLSEERITLWKDVMKTKSPTSNIVFLPNKKDLITDQQEKSGITSRPSELACVFERQGKQKGSKYYCIQQDFTGYTISKDDSEKLDYIFSDIYNELSIYIGYYNISPTTVVCDDSKSISKKESEVTEEEKTHQMVIDKILRSEKIHDALDKIIFPQKAQGFPKERIENNIAEAFKVNELWPPVRAQVSVSSSSSSNSEIFIDGEIVNPVLNIQPIKNNLDQCVTQMLNSGYTADEIETAIVQKLNQGWCPRQPWWKTLTKKFFTWFKL